jgi:hypothetical protein
MSTINKQKSKTVSKKNMDLMTKSKDIVLKDLIYKFNMVIMGMIQHITTYYSDSSMAGMELILSDIIDKMPQEPISVFLINIYKNDEYRLNILKENDKFFMEESYDDFTGGDDERTTKLFQFKNLWKQIDQETKDFIKKSMMTLVKICQKYILNL